MTPRMRRRTHDDDTTHAKTHALLGEQQQSHSQMENALPRQVFRFARLCNLKQRFPHLVSEHLSVHRTRGIRRKNHVNSPSMPCCTPMHVMVRLRNPDNVAVDNVLYAMVAIRRTLQPWVVALIPLPSNRHTQSPIGMIAPSYVPDLVWKYLAL